LYDLCGTWNLLPRMAFVVFRLSMELSRSFWPLKLDIEYWGILDKPATGTSSTEAAGGYLNGILIMAKGFCLGIGAGACFGTGSAGPKLMDTILIAGGVSSSKTSGIFRHILVFFMLG
jgi:hypothetical protein